MMKVPRPFIMVDRPVNILVTSQHRHSLTASPFSYLQISLTNVKLFLMESSTFSHLPPSSLVIKKTSKVIIRDCIFLRMYPSSITVSQTKRVEVVHNELSLNAIKAVSTSDGSHLFISCNRSVCLSVKSQHSPEIFKFSLPGYWETRWLQSASQPRPQPPPRQSW